MEPRRTRSARRIAVSILVASTRVSFVNCSENVSDEGSLLESGRLLERDSVSEGLELSLVSSHGALRMTPIEVIRAEFVVCHAVAHNVVRDLENLVAHRHDGLLVAPMPLHAVIARLQGR